MIEAYKKDIDRTLLRENLKLTPEQRLRKLQSAVAGLASLQEAFVREQRTQYASHERWQDVLIAALGSGVDQTLVIESLRMTPTERLETMRRAALSLASMTDPDSP